jgi:hypothetical protein
MIDVPPPGWSPVGTLRQLAPYVIAGAAYIAMGVLEPRLLLSWIEGIAFVFAAVWGVPAFFRRLRR